MKGERWSFLPELLIQRLIDMSRPRWMYNSDSQPYRRPLEQLPDILPRHVASDLPDAYCCCGHDILESLQQLGDVGIDAICCNQQMNRLLYP